MKCRNLFLYTCALTPFGWVTLARAQVLPAPTVAGTAVTNVATVTAGLDANQITIPSNQARLTVAERLDIVLRAPATTLQIPVGATAVPFTLTNGGNGSEAFVLDARIENAGATALGFAVDRNGDGAFDPAVDLAVALNGTTPVLAPGQSTALLVLLRGDTAGTAGTLTVRGSALTGSGAPGTLFPARGDGGGDALVGPTGATSALTFTLAVTAGGGPDPITLVKSQQVAGPGNTTVPAPGATVTYTIVANFGVGAHAAQLVDPVPTGTAYVAGSLSLDGGVLSDAADGDAGRFDGSGIAVALGEVPAAATHTVQFKVIIQ